MSAAVSIPDQKKTADARARRSLTQFSNCAAYLIPRGRRPAQRNLMSSPRRLRHDQRSRETPNLVRSERHGNRARSVCGQPCAAVVGLREHRGTRFRDTADAGENSVGVGNRDIRARIVAHHIPIVEIKRRRREA